MKNKRNMMILKNTSYAIINLLLIKKNKYYKKLMKVKDHDHYKGKYRGAAHSICNLRCKTQKDIPVAIHNGSNYDFHIIITELAK